MIQLQEEIFSLFQKRWALVCAGTMERHNAMTIGWGGLGTLWNRPAATVYVRPNRYTYRFLEENEYFTVSFYPEEQRRALEIMGTVSGADVDKDAAAGLTPVPAGESVTYAQAELTLVCRKLYRQDMDASQIPEDVQATFYGGEPVHRMYVGQVVDVLRP